MSFRIISPNEFFGKINFVIKQIRHPNRATHCWSPTEKPLISKAHAIAIVMFRSFKVFHGTRSSNLHILLRVKQVQIRLSFAEIEDIFFDANHKSWETLRKKMSEKYVDETEQAARLLTSFINTGKNTIKNEDDSIKVVNIHVLHLSLHAKCSYALQFYPLFRYHLTFQRTMKKIREQSRS